MDPGAIIYLLSGAALAAILIWGGLEWYAAVLLGFIAPFVGLILAIPLNLLVALVLPSSAISGDSAFIASMAISQILVLGGAVLLAKSMRKTKQKPRKMSDAGLDSTEDS